MIFRQPPRAGDAFNIDGQEITCIGSGPHTTRDNREIVLIEWSAQCRTCPSEYHFKTTLDPTRGAKRCRACIDANPRWRPNKGISNAVAKRNRNARISAALIAHHDKRLGRKVIGEYDDRFDEEA